MIDKIKQLLIGPPLPAFQLADNRLNKLRALAARSPDALSYFQTIHAWPSGSGSWSAARAELDPRAGLIAATRLRASLRDRAQTRLMYNRRNCGSQRVISDVPYPLRK